MRLGRKPEKDPADKVVGYPRKACNHQGKGIIQQEFHLGLRKPQGRPENFRNKQNKRDNAAHQDGYQDIGIIRPGRHEPEQE